MDAEDDVDVGPDAERLHTSVDRQQALARGGLRGEALRQLLERLRTFVPGKDGVQDQLTRCLRRVRATDSILKIGGHVGHGRIKCIVAVADSKG